ncbi:MAG: heavy metal translocating P-type ATPase, partial [Candidatus Limnocylindria bacterium]
MDHHPDHSSSAREDPTQAAAGHADHGAHPRPDRQVGHDKHAGHDPNAFRRQFWILLALTIPVVFFSRDVQELLGYRAPVFLGSVYIPAVLGAIVFAYGGRVFLDGARTELGDRQPGMMTLISLAISVAFIASAAATLGVFEVEVWWELATLITVMSLGHWLEMRAIQQARGALDALAALLPDEAELVTADGSIRNVPLHTLRVDDVVLVRPGTRVPADGEVVDGRADVDESMITGESRTVAKEPGSKVVAGTVAAGSSLRVRVEAVGEETALSGIMRLVARAQASRSRAQALADRSAALLFYVALASGLVTLVVWVLLGQPEDALIRTATVLVIACPHALGLAIPLVIAISTSLGARNGLLVKDRLALERAKDLDIVIFDKTGTLTYGKPALSGLAVGDGRLTEDELLALAAAVEADSEHPLAQAVVRAAAQRNLRPAQATNFESLAGRGVRAQVDGRSLTLGGPRLLADERLEVPATLRAETERWASEGATVLH